MQYISSLPPELCCKPDPLIVMSGLDTESNQVHRSIWKAFTCSRSYDRDPLRFRCLPVDHQFPRPKYKPTGTQEWFLPKGILKTGWMRKHLESIPAVVAVFFTLDWSEHHWEERSSECARLVDTVRANLAGRDSKLVLILIQTRALLPLGEDLNAMERAQALCAKCDLPGKNLFVLSHTNLLYGCITRLESEFRDIAANYYHQRIKKIKAQKDILNKSSHQLLFTRHEFKIAFFAELMQDTSLALKHYHQAYSHLLEQRMIDIHALEVKTVAAFINYKICRLAFQTNASDAISQFRKHIEFFSTFSGMPQLAFEHEAWMSKQFEILGDLFQEAIQHSLTALMTQHPGLYYQEAARHAMARRQLCYTLCYQNDDASDPTSDGVDCQVPSAPDTDALPFTFDGVHEGVPSHVIETTMPKRITPVNPTHLFRAQSPLRFTKRSSLDSQSGTISGSSISMVPANDLPSSVSATEKVAGLEFYGQRPWRQGIQSIEPPNPIKEQQGIQSLQKAERLVDHSALIIPLLEQAHLHYTRYKAERMKLYPLVLMGSEYYRNGNYEKALNCYASVIKEYRAEKWWSIYTFILQHILNCAYMTKQFDIFLSAALELTGPESILSATRKNDVQRALFQILQCNKLEEGKSANTLSECQERTLTQPVISVTSDDSANNTLITTVSSLAASVRCAIPSKLSLDVSRLKICIECMASFMRPHYTMDQPVQIAVFLRSHAPLPFEIRRVKIEFTHKLKTLSKKDHVGDRYPIYQSSQSWSSPFSLPPSKSVIAVLFCLDPSTLGQHVKVDSVQVELTAPHTCENRCSATLVWRWSSLTSARTTQSTHTSSTLALSPTRRSHSPRSYLEQSHLSSDAEHNHQHDSTSVILSDNHMNFTFPELPATWDLIRPVHQTDIRDLSCGLQMALLHTSPALSQEIYTIHVDVSNKASTDATQISLSATLAEHSVPFRPLDTEGTVSFTKPTVSTEPSQTSFADALKEVSEKPREEKASNTRISSVSDTVELADMLPNEHRSQPLYICCMEPGRRNLRVQLTYQTRFPSSIVPNFLIALDSASNDTVCHFRVLMVDDHLARKHQDENLHVETQCVETLLTDTDVVTPFDLTCQVASIQLSPLSDLIVGEPFLLQPQLENTSTVDLAILSTTFQLSSAVVFVDKHPDVQIKDLNLDVGNRISECQVLEPTQVTEDDKVVSLGRYLVHWRRRTSCSSDPTSVVTTCFQLPSFTITKVPILLCAEIPTTGTMLTPFPVFYFLHNQTICPRELIIYLESSPGFMFSGRQKLRLRLLPGSPQVLHYVLLPLRAGYLAMPRIRLDFPNLNAPTPEEQQKMKLHLEEKILRRIPTHIFILPAAKHPTNVQSSSAVTKTVASTSA